MQIWFEEIDELEAAERDKFDVDKDEEDITDPEVDPLDY